MTSQLAEYLIELFKQLDLAGDVRWVLLYFASSNRQVPPREIAKRLFMLLRCSKMLELLSQPKNWENRVKDILKVAALALLMGGMGLSAANAGQIKVGMAPEPYPPFSGLDASGKWVGWEVDFVEAVCAEAKLDCVITPIAWDGVIPALSSKKIDMIVGSLGITEERRKLLEFSIPYFNVPINVIGRKGEEFNVTEAGLSGKMIGVQGSTIHQAYAEKYYAPLGAEIKEYQTQDEANQDLVAGRIDATQANAMALIAFLKSEQGSCCEEKSYVPDDTAILGTGVGVGLRKDDAELKEKLDAAIEAIQANGVYDTFSKKYFDFDISGRK